MGVVEDWQYMALAIEEDPDDWRPDSELAVIVDPSLPSGEFVRDIAVFRERIAPGDAIPLHEHTVEEVLFVDEGRLEVRLGDVRREVSAPAIVFVAARQPHGFRNVGEAVARVHAVFPTTEVTIRYRERNPAPGTEADPPGPPLAYEVRTLLEGDPSAAVRVMDEAEWP